MKPEVKKAFELIKNSCSKEEQIKYLFSDKDGDIELMNLKLKGLIIDLSGLEASYINNENQKAVWIDNSSQQAQEIDNDNQKII